MLIVGADLQPVAGSRTTAGHPRRVALVPHRPHRRSTQTRAFEGRIPGAAAKRTGRGRDGRVQQLDRGCVAPRAAMPRPRAITLTRAPVRGGTRTTSSASMLGYAAGIIWSSRADSPQLHAVRKYPEDHGSLRRLSMCRMRPRGSSTGWRRSRSSRPPHVGVMVLGRARRSCRYGSKHAMGCHALPWPHRAVLHLAHPCHVDRTRGTIAREWSLRGKHDAPEITSPRASGGGEVVTRPPPARRPRAGAVQAGQPEITRVSTGGHGRSITTVRHHFVH